MFNWIDGFIIDNYNDKLVLNDNIIPIARLCEESPELDKKVEIHMRKLNEVLYTRGGHFPNNKKRLIRSYPFNLPFNHMVIRPDGMVSLCSSDALGKMTLRNVKKIR